MKNPLTFCISTFNNLNYLKLAVESVRKHSHYKNAPFIIHAENCTDGTNEWLNKNKKQYDLTVYIENNTDVKGIGGGMNFCADKVQTEFIMFLHSDFYVSPDWDLHCMNVFEKYPNEKMWVFSQRIQPNIFSESSRIGTHVVDIDTFGSYYYDFDSEFFVNYAIEFSKRNDIEYEWAEGVSGLIRKKDWDFIGGNDSAFSPTSWEDKDLFLRMLYENYKLLLTTKSVVWHFGARGSHRLEENGGKSSERQIESEKKNIQNWINKWGKLPEFDQNGFIKKFVE
jgi:GT2 family glycosyltransferase